MERAILSDRYSPESLFNKRHQIRGLLLYPRGTPLSKSKYQDYLYVMENYGTHRSGPYRRITDAIWRSFVSLYKEESP